eukprot:364247-Chlamydomonas_euryale.AAC.18
MVTEVLTVTKVCTVAKVSGEGCGQSSAMTEQSSSSRSTACRFGADACSTRACRACGMPCYVSALAGRVPGFGLLGFGGCGQRSGRPASRSRPRSCTISLSVDSSCVCMSSIFSNVSLRSCAASRPGDMGG